MHDVAIPVGIDSAIDSAIEANRSGKEIGREATTRSGVSEMRVGDGFGIIATTAQLARVIHRPRACRLARMDGIGMTETRKPKLATCSTKSPRLSKPVRSLRRNRLDSGQRNRCEANDRRGVFESRTRGSCQRGNRNAKLIPSWRADSVEFAQDHGEAAWPNARSIPPFRLSPLVFSC